MQVEETSVHNFPSALVEHTISIESGKFKSQEKSDTVALNKCPKNKSRISWVWWMTGHVSIDGLIVYFITGSSLIALLEALLHFYIDYLKCIGKFNLLVDQMLHILCKCIWVLLI